MTPAPRKRTTAARNRARNIPVTMRAAAIDRFGGPDVLTLHVLPVPEIDPSEVLIATHTEGVGSWDADRREGWWPDGKRPSLPLVLGTDGSGTIAAVGSRSVDLLRATSCIRTVLPTRRAASMPSTWLWPPRRSVGRRGVSA